MVKELPESEQVMMDINEAGKIYKGYYIVTMKNDFTIGKGVPIVIGSSEKEVESSSILQKYANRTECQPLFHIDSFMDRSDFIQLNVTDK